MNITIVSTTSRNGSKTLELSHFVQSLFLKKGIEVKILDLRDLPEDFFTSVLYRSPKSNSFQEIQDVVTATDKFLFIIPEYNCSFPGILKSFVDALDFPKSFRGKKGGMIGLSDGTQGATVAMSHFSDILNYLGVILVSSRPRLINIGQHFYDGTMHQEIYTQHIERTLDELIAL
jgi:NAD(P)H-dependent FMN reductase